MSLLPQPTSPRSFASRSTTLVPPNPHLDDAFLGPRWRSRRRRGSRARARTTGASRCGNGLDLHLDLLPQSADRHIIVAIARHRFLYRTSAATTAVRFGFHFDLRSRIFLLDHYGCGRCWLRLDSDVDPSARIGAKLRERDVVVAVAAAAVTYQTNDMCVSLHACALCIHLHAYACRSGLARYLSLIRRFDPLILVPLLYARFRMGILALWLPLMRWSLLSRLSNVVCCDQ